ncbi:hypothetical protein G6F31_012345 [Rhizopus arrhizus]|nr:hypothetical protein G6F31_012345 [Rhizopus arrhizus]
MRQDLIQRYYSPGLQYNSSLLAEVKNVIIRFKNDLIIEEDMICQLLQLCSGATQGEKQVIRAVVEIVPHLYDYNLTDLDEAHLVDSYVHPFMHGLFSSRQMSKVAHCSNSLVHGHADTENSNCPDYKIDIYEAYEYAYTNVFGEVKTSKKTSHIQLAYDFCRCAIFFKDAIDSHNLSASLGLQSWFR